jgi:MscS family membrane protein
MNDWIMTHLPYGEYIAANLGWMIQIGVILMALVAASIVGSIAIARLETRFRRTRTYWDNAFLATIRSPIHLAIWIVGLSHIAEIIAEETRLSDIASSVPLMREIALTLVIGWSMLRFINEGSYAVVKGRTRRGKQVDQTTVDAISNILKACAAVTTILLMLQTLGYSLNAILTFGGISGVAVGFAAKDLLANFFGAIMVYYDKPFKLGNWIRSPDREIEGVVEKIGWRMTTIRTFDKRPLYVPNSVFTQIAVENPSRMSHRRIYETIGIRYDDLQHMQGITDEVRAMLQEHEDIDSSHTLMVHFNAFGASSCDFFIYCFTRTTDWQEYHRVKHEVLLKIADIISQHQSEIAYPTRTLHLYQGDVPPPTAQPNERAVAQTPASQSTRQRSGKRGSIEEPASQSESGDEGE